MWPYRVCLVVLGWLAATAVAQDVVEMPNAGFEQGGKGDYDRYCKAGWQPETGADYLGLPDQWAGYQWGPSDAPWSITVERGAGRNGSGALRTLNRDGRARAGCYGRAKLTPGTWRLSAWVRCPTGQHGRAALYLANAYSPPLKVTDAWREISVETLVGEPIAAAEINIQNQSGAGVAVWFDDVTLRRVKTTSFKLVDDDRAERPRTLLFSPINVGYLRDHAAECARWGFRGFLFDGVMSSWSSDVWAADGQPNTRGEDDALLREVRACNAACRAVGIDSNFVKVAFYEPLPDWFDDAAWTKVTELFRQGARFTKLSGCAGLAVDTEYVAEQYDPAWKGYQAKPRPLAELKAKVHQRWQTVVAAMLQEYPTMPVLTLPEGMLYYGELYGDLFRATLQACAEADAPGGLHVMTEGTYHTTDAGGLANAVKRVDLWVAEECGPKLADYWRRRCTVALGAWPLGYYRDIQDKDGKFLGYSGKKEQFGDRVVGSYADKSEWYAPAVFTRQMAGLNSWSPRYNWVYGHGCVFWQWTEDDRRRYLAGPHKVEGNSLLPTVKNLGEYLAAIVRPQRFIAEP